MRRLLLFLATICLAWLILDRFLRKPTTEYANTPTNRSIQSIDQQNAHKIHPIRDSNGKTDLNQISSPTTRSELTNAAFILSEAANFDDPAAGKIIGLLNDTGWSASEQALRFQQIYNQTLRIFFLEDLIAEDRLNMRTAWSGVQTNTFYTVEMKRDSHNQYENIRAAFERSTRNDQEELLTGLVDYLGPSPNIPSEELRRRLLEIHPRIPIDGPLTNLIPSPSTIVPQYDFVWVVGSGSGRLNFR